MNTEFKHALKLKVRFDRESALVLDGQSKILNWTYNHLLDRALVLRQQYAQSQDPSIRDILYTKRGLRNLLPGLKKEHPFLRSVHSSPLKNSALRLSASIQAYQKSRKGQRKGKRTGFPSFRSFRQKWFSILYDEPGKGFKVSGRCLDLSLGVTDDGKRIQITGVLEKSLGAFGDPQIQNLRITKEQADYFAVFTIARRLPAKKPMKKTISLDPNHKNLAYGVGNDGRGIEIKNPWFKKSMDRHIDSLKSRRDRCLRKSQKIVTAHGTSYWKPSRRWKRFHKKLDRLHSKRRDQTKTYLYTVGNALYRDYDVVAIGNYTPRGGGISRGMRRAMNNESLIGRFKNILSWLAMKSGKAYLEWDERNSTKTCSACNFQHETSINPDIREWRCPGCSKHHIRDENAALNGLYKVTEEMMPGSGRLEVNVTSRRAWKFDGLGIVSIPGIINGIVA